MASESIYGWIKEAPPPPQKPPMYHSRIDPTKLEIPASTFRQTAVRKPYGAVGREVKATVRPDAFLKAHEKTTTGIDPKTMPAPFVRKEEPRKPAVPRKEDAPLHGLSSGRDFVTTNAVDAMLALPRAKPVAEAPDWRARPGFGKAPAYLADIKRSIEAEHEYIQSLLDQRAMAAEEEVPMRELSMEERAELTEALKTKWDQVNRAYQRVTWKRMSAATASIGDMQWKENCERQLAQLEADIQKLSVRAPILVVDEARAGAPPAAAATAAPGASAGAGGGSASSMARSVTGGSLSGGGSRYSGR